MILSEICQETAEKLYNHLTQLRRSGEHWDEWDDKREIEQIASQLTDLCSTAYIKGALAERDLANSRQ